jgi:hypothetical protein
LLAGAPIAATSSNLPNAAKAPALSSSNAQTTLSAKANSNASTFGGATAYTIRQQQNQTDCDLLEDASKWTSFYTDHIDSDQVAHANVRWMPQQGFFDGRKLSDLVFPKIIGGGKTLRLIFQNSPLLYDLVEISESDKIRGMHPHDYFSGVAAMQQRSIEHIAKHGQGDGSGKMVHWVKHDIKLEKEMSSIEEMATQSTSEVWEEFQKKGKKDVVEKVQKWPAQAKCVLIKLRGPDSEYKIRKLTEGAVHQTSSSKCI